MEELALQSVRKPKAKKTHLTVPAPESADIRTLCGVDMKAGEYQAVEDGADCQPCLRRRGNRAFISSAYFAQDAGTKLLEMSLAQTKRDGAKKKPSKPTAPSGRRTLRVVDESEAAESQGPSVDHLAAMGLDRLVAAGPQVFRSPAGVLVRVQKAGAGWRIAEVTFEGPSRVRVGHEGTVTRIGDLEVLHDSASGDLRVKKVG